MRKLFFMKQLNAWYVWYHGKQIRLDVDKAKAFQMFHEMMAREAPAQTSDSVASLCNLYLEWCEKKRAPEPTRAFAIFSRPSFAPLERDHPEHWRQIRQACVQLGKKGRSAGRQPRFEKWNLQARSGENTRRHWNSTN